MNAKVTTFPEDLHIGILEDDPLVGVGELADLWENDAMFEAMILEEENERAAAIESSIPEWARLLF